MRARGKLRGTGQCALCDITHGAVSKKGEWVALERGLPRPVELVHLNERPPDLAAATQGITPCVVGQREGRFEMLLGPEALEACGGSVATFRVALERALSFSGERDGS